MDNTASEEGDPYDGPQWEYAAVSAPIVGDKLLDKLNEHGLRGWEAVGIASFGPASSNSLAQVILKRRVR